MIVFVWTERLQERVSELRALGAFPDLAEETVDELEIGEAGA